MRNWMIGFWAFCLLATPASAHEFWIEPQEFTLPSGGTFEPKVRVGEHLGGRAFPFTAGGYEKMLWVGPQRTRVLAGDKRSGSIPSLGAMGEGLHVLAVASFPQHLVYETEADFHAFVGEIRANSSVPGATLAAADGRPRESYRRFSKTLVHFGKKTGDDAPLGLAREWVKSGNRFTLYRDGAPVPDQPTTLFCRIRHSGHHHVREIQLTTNAEGAIAPKLPRASICLINAVLLEPTAKQGHWKSDWVSMLWEN